jgi:TPR repeat protein
MKSLLLGIFLISGLAGCSSLNIMRPASCSSSSENPEIAALMVASCKGDLHASLRLGTLYENGNGVEADGKKAREFFTIAATTSSGQTSIWVPGAGSVPGHLMMVNSGPAVLGLPEAQYRLALLYEQGVGGKRDQGKAKKWLQRAAAQGHLQAIKMLAMR